MSLAEERKYKRLFAQTLKPFFDLLTAQKEEFSVGNWMEKVEKVRLRATINSEQYLGQDLPSPAIVKKILIELFDGYLKRSL